MHRLAPILLAALTACATASAPGEASCPEPETAPERGDPLAVVRGYLEATASGDLGAAADLVVDDSVVFESGGNEGTWGHYREHHLAPELDQFAAFEIREGEPAVATSEDGSLVVVTLPMEYDITLKDDRKIESVGTVTFSLRGAGEGYKIQHMHWSSRRKRKPSPPEDLLALEKAAYEAARPVFEKHCGRCHATGGAKANKKKLSHFDMSTYPFGGHHAAEMGTQIRASLGAGEGKATMPMGKAGSVKGDDLEAILTWADAFTRAEAAGLHARGSDDGHGGGDGHGH